MFGSEFSLERNQWIPTEETCALEMREYSTYFSGLMYRTAWSTRFRQPFSHWTVSSPNAGDSDESGASTIYHSSDPGHTRGANTGGEFG